MNRPAAVSEVDVNRPIAAVSAVDVIEGRCHLSATCKHNDMSIYVSDEATDSKAKPSYLDERSEVGPGSLVLHANESEGR